MHFSAFEEWIERLDEGTPLEVQLERDEHGRLRASAARFVLESEPDPGDLSGAHNTSLETVRIDPLSDVESEASLSAVDYVDSNVWREGKIVRTGPKFAFAKFEDYERPVFVPFGAFDRWVHQLDVGERIHAQVGKDREGRLTVVSATRESG